MNIRVLALAAIGAIILAGCSAVSESTTSIDANGGTHAANAKRGAALFAANCATCHGAHGEGGGIGPSLLDERQRLDDAATVSWIEDPQTPMPKLYPAPLSGAQVRDVAAYVQSL